MKTEKRSRLWSEKGLSEQQDGIRLSFTGQDVERIKVVNKQLTFARTGLTLS